MDRNAPVPANNLINLDNKTDRLQLFFVLGSSAVGYLSFALLPLLSAWGIMTLGLSLWYSIEKWTNTDLIPLPESPPVEFFVKGMLGAVVLLAGLYFSSFTPFSQIIFGIAASAGLSAYFINQCVVAPQRKLNEALRNAVTEHNIENVNTLLDRGADPFDCNPELNNCFHLAISDHENSALILDALIRRSQTEKIIIKDVLLQAGTFVNTNILTRGVQWLNAILRVISDRGEDNRAALKDASESLLSAVAAPFQAIIRKGFSYVQQHIENERNLRQVNQANSSPEQLIDIVIKTATNPRLQTLKAIFARVANAGGANPIGNAVVGEQQRDYLPGQRAAVNADVNEDADNEQVPAAAEEPERPSNCCVM